MTNSIIDQFAQDLKGKSKPEVVQELIQFMETRGQTNYDESVKQIEHALQCAELARQNEMDDASVTAALFHDIGHLLVDEHDEQSAFLDQDLSHEEVGAEFLTGWFPPAVTEPIRLHVVSKRYLCTVEESYYEGLSQASKRSFQLQGGRLSDDERATLEESPYLPVALQLRRYDDLGKVENLEVPAIDVYTETILRSLNEASS